MISNIARNSASFGSVRFILGSTEKRDNENFEDEYLKRESAALKENIQEYKKFEPVGAKLEKLGFSFYAINDGNKYLGEEYFVRANEELPKEQKDKADQAVKKALEKTGIARNIGIFKDNHIPFNVHAGKPEPKSDNPDIQAAIDMLDEKEWEK